MSTQDEVAVTGSEAQWDEEFPSVDASGIRRRLFTVLAWAAGGFVGVAALSMVLASVFGHLLREIGFGVAALCVGAGLGGFVLVVAVSNGLDERRRTAAQALLWATVLVYAVLINPFAAALLGAAHVGAVALAVVATGAAVIVILAIAIVIGFEDSPRLFLRWGAVIALVTVPVCVVEAELWWAGLIGGFLLALAVEVTMNEALKRWHVPEPALAACLVAGVTAMVLLVIYVVVRYVVRLTASVVAGAAEGAAKS